MRDPGDSQVPPLYRFCRDLVTDDRGQTEVVGAVMLIAVTVMGTVGIVALGSTALNDTKDAMNTQAAEHTMTQFDAQVAEVALGSSEIKTAKLPETGAQASAKTTDDGWIRMKIINESSGDPVTDGDPVFNHSLGAVVWERGNNEIAYQGGGVWRKAGENATMVSPPELHFRGETLTIPVVQVTGDRQLDGDVTIEQNASTSRSYPNADFANPFEKVNRSINITVKSEYYQGWADYLETRTEGDTFVDHANETVTVQLVAEAGIHEVTAGIGATAAGEDLVISGGGGSPTFVDSYNSSDGDYSSSNSDNGSVLAAGDVDLSGNAEIRGNFRVGGEYEQSGTSDVFGNVSHTDGYTKTGAGVQTGWEAANATVDGTPSIDSFVNNTVSDIENNNDNGDVGVPISGNEIQYTSGVATLTEGRYFLDNLTVGSGETLELDAGTGPITIAVRDFADIQGTVDVLDVSTHEVEIYVLGEATTSGGGCSSCHFTVNGGTVDVPDDNSTMLWVYGPRKLTGEVNGGGTFKGVVYAPSASQASNPGEFFIGTSGPPGTEVFGGIVTGTVEIGPKATVHFDQALFGMQAVPTDTSVVLVSYIQVTRNEVRVES